MKDKRKKSKPSAKFYSIDKHVYSKGKWKYIKNRDGTLFSGGNKKSIYSDYELPNYYVYGVYRGIHGYLCAKGIKDIVIAEPFEDDYLLNSVELLISYKNKIIKDNNSGDLFGYINYDFYFSGTEIIYFLKSVKEHSDIDILPLIRQLSRRKHRIINSYDVLYDKDLLRFREEEFA